MGRIGVLLLNLGGPDKIEDVRPFLYNLFADPEIIRLPVKVLQKPLAWLISTARAKTSQANYLEMRTKMRESKEGDADPHGGSPLLKLTEDQANALNNGGSPLRKITEDQATALENKLRDLGQDAKIYIGMRYWHPFTEEAIAQIKNDGIKELVILPLYPQFSISTSGSSFRVLEQMWSEDPALRQIEYTLVPSWYEHPGYLQSMAKLIADELDTYPNPDQAHVFFSAHGVPVSYVEEAGDPYQEQIEACTRLIMKTLGRPNDYTLAYQSKVGPVDWLQPYTDDALKELGEKGIKDLAVVPISFVSEHIETIQEIDMEYREVAEEAGIDNFRCVPALNDDPDFIDSLANIVVESLAKPPCSFGDVTHPKKNMKMYPQEKWEWGLTTAAEVWNGRFAMIGFLGLLAELLSGSGPLHMVGIL
ncbi:MAG: ferrochelatase [Cyanobacteria bacterium J06621_8]